MDGQCAVVFDGEISLGGNVISTGAFDDASLNPLMSRGTSPSIEAVGYANGALDKTQAIRSYV